MRRREVLATLAAGAWPLAVRAQEPGKVARIGFLSTRSVESPDSAVMFDALRQGLHDRGYVEGHNIAIEVRGADGQIERFPARARELVDLKLDVIVTSNSLAARAVQQATSTIPIVVPVMGDLVGDGLVTSLARPGRNITGLTFLGPALVPKRLGLLKEALPTVSKVATLWHPGAYGERTMANMMQEATEAARTLDLELQFVPVHGPEELDEAFSRITRERVDALLVFPSPMLFTERRQIVDLALKHRLPSMAMGREFVQLGGLMSYGASISDMHYRAAAFVDQIVKGAKPGDLPVQVPTKFEFAINLKTARALGLTVPLSLQAQADEVIE
jgi:putative ABC transport system substrate-binding protein